MCRRLDTVREALVGQHIVKIKIQSISIHEIIPNDGLHVAVQALDKHAVQVTGELLLVENAHPAIAIAAADRGVAPKSVHLHGVGQRHLYSCLHLGQAVHTRTVGHGAYCVGQGTPINCRCGLSVSRVGVGARTHHFVMRRLAAIG